MSASVSVERAYSPSMTGTRLVGRDAEIGVLNTIVDHLPERGGALILRGEAGIGKTSLLRVATERARDSGARVLSTTGAQSEADLAFSGLHQLLLPILAGLGRLPILQSAALAGAFGISDAPVSDLYLIALAALGLLADAAERTPLLLICEDAHWLDRPSADALAFVARRLESEPVALLFAVRDGYPSALDAAGLAELRLEGIERDAAAELLDSRHAALSPKQRELVLSTAAGNPLALLELPDAIQTAHGQDKPPIPGTVSLTARLEDAFAQQQSGLPAVTRLILLIAAADDELACPELLAAASVTADVEVTADALAPALEAGLATIDERGHLSFRHPLVRSAIYQAAEDAEQRAVHAALADVLAEQPDRATWHRAASCVGPDESIACELEELAARLCRRGGVSVAVSALERSARLSADPAARTARLLQAAELGFQMGRRELVERLVVAAERLNPDSPQRARILWLREIFTDGVPGDATRVNLLVGAAETANQDGDLDLALNLLLGGALRSWWADPGEAARARVVQVAEKLHTEETDPRLVATLAVAAPIERGSVVLARLSEIDAENLEDPQAAYLGGMAAHAVSDYELAARFLDSAGVRLRAQGRLGLLAQALVLRGWEAIMLGNWTVARPALDEGGRLAEETSQPIWTAGAQIGEALLAGASGDFEQAERLVAQAEQVTIPNRLSDMLCIGALARGVSALGAGRHDDALEHLRSMFCPGDPAFHRADRFMGIDFFADAARQADQCELARETLSELEAVARQTASPAVQLGIVYARPVLAEDQHAERLYQEALSQLAGSPFVRARLQLGYGAWLRRQRRPAESRTPLRAARETFDALGASPWGERARQELRASGERSRQRTPDLRDQLTPQELQIAQMAAAGLSNREIGQQLYISPRTVSSHLYKLFPKLGITSRAQLAGALGIARQPR